MKLLYKAIVEMLEELDDFGRKRFELSRGGGGMWMYFSVLNLYSSGIFEGKETSCVKHVLTVKKPCVRCMTTRSDIQNLRSSLYQTLKEVTSARSQYRKCLEAFEYDKRKINVVKEKS